MDAGRERTAKTPAEIVKPIEGHEALSVGIQVLVAMGPGLYSQICWRERWATSTSAFIADTSLTLAAKGARGAYRVLVKVRRLVRPAPCDLATNLTAAVYAPAH